MRKGLNEKPQIALLQGLTILWMCVEAATARPLKANPPLIINVDPVRFTVPDDFEAVAWQLGEIVSPNVEAGTRFMPWDLE